MQPGGPGWNDPPKLNYKVHSETKSRRNLLNKRVAYLGNELKGCDSPPGVTLDPNKPPPMSKPVAKLTIDKEQTKKPVLQTESPTFFTPGAALSPPGVEPVTDDKTTVGDPDELEFGEDFEYLPPLLQLVDKLQV